MHDGQAGTPTPTGSAIKFQGLQKRGGPAESEAELRGKVFVPKLELGNEGIKKHRLESLCHRPVPPK